MSNEFNTNKNIDLLWEVLLDENHVKSLNSNEKQKLYDLLNNHRKLFYEKEKNNATSLVNMNKKFLSLFIKFINSNIKDNLLKQEKNTNIYNKEDLQIQKLNKFQKDLIDKKKDFENTINFIKPPEIDFSEKIEETKIKGMDELIAKTIEKRNYEISQIQNNSYNTNTLDIIPIKKDNTNTTFKQIKIEDIIPVEHEIINLNTSSLNEKKMPILNLKIVEVVLYFNYTDIFNIILF